MQALWPGKAVAKSEADNHFPLLDCVIHGLLDKGYTVTCFQSGVSHEGAFFANVTISNGANHINGTMSIECELSHQSTIDTFYNYMFKFVESNPLPMGATPHSFYIVYAQDAYEGTVQKFTWSYVTDQFARQVAEWIG